MSSVTQFNFCCPNCSQNTVWQNLPGVNAQCTVCSLIGTNFLAICSCGKTDYHYVYKGKSGCSQCCGGWPVKLQDNSQLIQQLQSQNGKLFPFNCPKCKVNRTWKVNGISCNCQSCNLGGTMVQGPCSKCTVIDYLYNASVPVCFSCYS